jgi:hypothetical protein
VTLTAASFNPIVIPVGELEASDDGIYGFGRSLLLDDTRGHVIASHPDKYHDFGGGAKRSGGAFVFDTQDGSLVQAIYPDNVADQIDYAYFGWAMALSGNWLAITSVGEGAGRVPQVHFYEWTGSVYTARQRLTGGTTVSGDSFGYSVALSGSTCLVGADEDNDNGTNSGTVFCFRLSGTWSEDAGSKIVAPDTQNNQYFGHKVSLDGTYAAISARQYDGDFVNQGRLFIFEDQGASFTQAGSGFNPGGVTNDNFFTDAVCVSGERIAASWPWYDSGGSPANFGVARTLKRDGVLTWSFDAPLLEANPRSLATDGTLGWSWTTHSGLHMAGVYLLVGSRGWTDDVLKTSNPGGAFLFGVSGGVFSQLGYVNTGINYSEFGAAVAVTSGGKMAVAAPSEYYDDGGDPDAWCGALYLYDYETGHPLYNRSFEEPGTDPGDADWWTEEVSDTAEDVAGFSHSSTYTRPWDDFEDSWDGNQNAQTEFGVTDTVAALFEDGAYDQESFEFSWREPSTGAPVGYNHQSTVSFDISNFDVAEFDITPEDQEDYEEDWGVSPYNQGAIDDYTSGTFSRGMFDGSADNDEDYENNWGISPYNQDSETVYSAGNFTAAVFPGPDTFEDFEGGWTEALP